MQEQFDCYDIYVCRSEGFFGYPYAHEQFIIWLRKKNTMLTKNVIKSS